MVLEALQRPGVRIALVGASNDPAKFGNRIFRDLVAKGYAVWPVNPREPEIEGVAAHADLESLPGTPDIVNFVVPPKVALVVAKQALALGIRRFWFQPGSESDELKVWLAEQEGVSALTDACIMVQSAG
jgi:predicted CoA-binding protein